MTDTMTEKAPSIWPVALKWGLLSGVVSILYALFGYITESFGNIFITMLVAIVIYILTIVLAIKDFKKSNYGYMTYLQGLGIGIIATLVAGILSGLFAMAYLQFVDPSISEKMVDAAIEQMSSFGIDESALEEQRDQILAESTPVNQLWGAIKNSFFTGLILSLIISAIMKHNRPEFE